MDFDVSDLLHRVSGDRQLAVRVLDRFVDDIPCQLVALARAVEAGDAQTGAGAAHAIRGAAANVGGFRMTELAGRIERLCSGGELDAAARLGAELASAFDQSVVEIANFRAEQSVRMARADRV